MDRFWSKTRREGSCLIWTGGTTDGYGRFYLNGKMVYAHRVAWELTNGPIPSSAGHHGTVIRHRCHTPLCVEPTHLLPGTQLDNLHDAIERGTFHFAPPAQIGEAHHSARLTEDDVRRIRNRAEQGELQRCLAEEFGVAQTSVSSIIRRETWKHVA